jgi:EmrB/QacA subfamily drug resistance transporter
VYVVGFGLFVVGSALSGLAATVGALIAWRAFQAVGGAMVLSNAPAILVGSFPPAQRGRALGLQATMTYLGLSTGPALGGLLATQFSWRAVFYINVPVGLLALALSVRFVPREPPADFAERFDLTGAFTFLLGLVALLLALNQGPEWGWASAPVLASFAVAAVSLGAFLGTESKVVAPMLDLSLFRRRIFSAASASAVMNYVCLYSVLFLLPFYLIQGRGLTAEQAGLVLTAEPVVMAIAAPISGSLSDWIGSRLLSTAGMLILAGGMFWLSRLGPAVPLTRVALALAVVGLGIGAFIAPNTSALMGAAPRQRHGTAAGVLATARNVGMVLGVGLAAAVLTSYVPDADAATAGPALFAGVSAGLLVAAGVACIGSLTSAVRGSTHPPADR